MIRRIKEIEKEGSKGRHITPVYIVWHIKRRLVRKPENRFIKIPGMQSYDGGGGP